MRKPQKAKLRSQTLPNSHLPVQKKSGKYPKISISDKPASHDTPLKL